MTAAIDKLVRLLLISKNGTSRSNWAKCIFPLYFGLTFFLIHFLGGSCRNLWETTIVSSADPRPTPDDDDKVVSFRLDAYVQERSSSKTKDGRTKDFLFPSSLFSLTCPSTVCRIEIYGKLEVCRASAACILP
jgi:hypothetical protein